MREVPPQGLRTRSSAAAGDLALPQ